MASKNIIYQEQSFKLSYEIRNPKQEEVILILHGWGSNKEIMMQAFAKTMPHLKHIYLDMAGFGKSSNPMTLTTHDYAKITTQFIEALGAEVKIAMGHSFGGKVATLLGTPYLVLLSSSGVCVPKRAWVRFKIALFKLLKPLMRFDRVHQWFVSEDAKGMSPQMYETFKNVVNEDFERHFEQSRSQALCFWGKEDTATPLWSGEKIATMLDAPLYPLDGDHFFFLYHSDSIADHIDQHFKD
jgi:pimeloyl-ACP methyl ester carboxylesterase